MSWAYHIDYNVKDECIISPDWVGESEFSFDEIRNGLTNCKYTIRYN